MSKGIVGSPVLELTIAERKKLLRFLMQHGVFWASSRGSGFFLCVYFTYEWLLIQAETLCLWISSTTLLTHAYLSWRRLCSLCGIQTQPYNQLTVINRSPDQTNLAVTTNKHLWGRFKARRGFFPTLMRAHTHTKKPQTETYQTHTWTLNVPLPTHSIVVQCVSLLHYYFPLQKQTPSLPLDWEIS